MRDFPLTLNNIPPMKYFLSCVFALALVCAHAQDQKKDAPSSDTQKPSTTNEVAIVSTTAGDMVLQFWPDVAPGTVENFKKLARKGFFDGTAFHRIIKGFMIQGGDPNTKDPSKEDSFGQGGPGYNIKGEVNSRKHIKGVISMAHSGHPDTAGSQFFICLDAAPHLDNKYTAFGKLIKGEDVLEKIGDTPVTRNKFGEPSKPKQRIEIKSVKIVPADSIK